MDDNLDEPNRTRPKLHTTSCTFTRTCSSHCTTRRTRDSRHHGRHETALQNNIFVAIFRSKFRVAAYEYYRMDSVMRNLLSVLSLVIEKNGSRSNSNLSLPVHPKMASERSSITNALASEDAVAEVCFPL